MTHIMVVSDHKCDLGPFQGILVVFLQKKGILVVSVCILRGEGLKINFPVAHAVHIKSVCLKILAYLML
jgi:hypothetical protein